MVTSGRRLLEIAGFIVGLLGIVLSVYTEFFRDTSPALRFEVVSHSNVLDINESLSDLQVLYRGTDIQKTGESLQAVDIKITNTGRQSINVGSYDARAPLALAVSGGTVVKVDGLGASNTYLSQNLAASEKEGLIVFPPLIIDGGDWFAIKLLALQAKGQKLSIRPDGKVSGVRTLSWVDNSDLKAPSIFFVTFGGNVTVQVMRLIGYTLAFAGLMGITISMGVKFSDRREQQERRQLITAFSNDLSEGEKEFASPIFDNFMKKGTPWVTAAVLAARSPEVLKRAANPMSGPISIGGTHQFIVTHDGTDTLSLDHILARDPEHQIGVLRSLIELNLASVKDGIVVIKPEALELLSTFWKHLRNQTIKRRKIS